MATPPAPWNSPGRSGRRSRPRASRSLPSRADPVGPTLPGMPKQIAPFLMFTGQAEEAMTLYTSLFDDGRIADLTRHGAEGPGTPGTVQRARFTLAGQDFLCTDSPPVHEFSFTPSFSIWIETESEDELERIFAALADGG